MRAGQSGGIHPTFISDHLHRYGAHGWVTVEPAAWNTGDHRGAGFVQWTGSAAQRDALARLATLSDTVHAVPSDALNANPRAAEQLEQALWRVLRAETSCNFYWGEAWVERCHQLAAVVVPLARADVVRLSRQEALAALARPVATAVPGVAAQARAGAPTVTTGTASAVTAASARSAAWSIPTGDGRRTTSNTAPRRRTVRSRRLPTRSRAPTAPRTQSRCR